MAIHRFHASSALLGLLALQNASANCVVGVVAELKVRMDGMRPTVTAGLNGREAKFIADSGAFYSVIGTASAAEYNLRTTPAPPGFQLQGVGGRTDAAFSTVKEFTLAGVAVHNVQFIVGGGEPGGGAVGVLGQNVWRLADVEYDLANGVIRLMKPQGCPKDTPLAYWAREGEQYSVMDIAWATASQPHTTGTVYLNGRKLRAIFDTGASASMLTVRAAEEAGAKTDGPDTTKGGMWRGIGSRTVQTYIAPFDVFKIGDEEIKHTRLRFGGIGNLNADMLIGADFFLSHRVYVASSQAKVYFTYNGGPVFNLAAVPARPQPPADAETAAAKDADSTATNTEPKPDATPAGEPTDAAGFSRRGTAYTARRDFEHAIADLTRATELAPNEADYLFERARAYLASRQPQLAAGDLDAAIKLKPDHVQALTTRAGMRLARGEARTESAAGAIADLDAASAASDKDSDVRFELGNLYARAAAYQAAIGQYDQWLDRHTEDSRTPDARAGRCRARALLNQDLDDALTDCNRAIRARSDAPFFHDSRGLVYMRMGRYDKAIADYEATLKAQPKNPWALYGLGIARVRQGMESEGRADIAAARASGPGIVALAERLGFEP